MFANRFSPWKYLIIFGLFYSNLPAGELIIKQAVKSGETTFISKNKDGTDIIVSAFLHDTAIMGWNGNLLGIHVGSASFTKTGAGIWDGSSFQLYGAIDWPFDGFTHGEKNRDGNPPSKPVFDVFKGLRVLNNGGIIFHGRLNDEDTVLPEVFWQMIGTADGSGFTKHLEREFDLQVTSILEASPDGKFIFVSDL
ncbi:MAG: hypothetical protein O7C75_06030, partial [Verrucomicrobia bacterium]|nr:hypothetical protein [Verrucomicrobiota bacterium]